MCLEQEIYYFTDKGKNNVIKIAIGLIKLSS